MGPAAPKTCQCEGDRLTVTPDGGLEPAGSSRSDGMRKSGKKIENVFNRSDQVLQQGLSGWGSRSAGPGARTEGSRTIREQRQSRANASISDGRSSDRPAGCDGSIPAVREERCAADAALVKCYGGKSAAVMSGEDHRADENRGDERRRPRRCSRR